MTRDDDTVGEVRVPRALVRDPVCGMMVAPEQTPRRERHEGSYVEALALIWERQPPGASPGSDRAERVRRLYRRNAGWYDPAVAHVTARLRAEAVAQLALGEGARVLDLGCGTGLSLPLLRAAVGPSGAVCFYTNDILISPTALPRAFGVLRPGARIVVAGVKLAPGWRGALVNLITRATRPSPPRARSCASPTRICASASRASSSKSTDWARSTSPGASIVSDSAGRPPRSPAQRERPVLHRMSQTSSPSERVCGRS